MKPFSFLSHTQPHGRLLTELDLNNIIIATTQSVSDGVQFELAKIKVLIIYFLYAFFSFLVSSFLLSLSLTFLFFIDWPRWNFANHHLNGAISILRHDPCRASKRRHRTPHLNNRPLNIQTPSNASNLPPLQPFAASYRVFKLFISTFHLSPTSPNRLLDRTHSQPLQEKDVRIILGNFGESWARKIFCEVRDKNALDQIELWGQVYFPRF